MPKSSVPHAQVRPRTADEQLAVIEATGLVGAWHWSFSDNAISWSRGYYRLFGLDPLVVQPGWGVVAELIHPDDRRDTSDPAALYESEGFLDRVLRVLRPDGSLRFVRSISEPIYDRSGVAKAARGVLFDVSDASYARLTAARYAKALRLLERTSRAVALHRKNGDEVDVSWVSDHDQDEVLRAWRSAKTDGKPFTVSDITDREDRHVTLFMEPVMVDTGETEWIGAVILRQDKHFAGELPAWSIRAARAMLDWSIADLARHARVSASTIRRVEDENERSVRSSSTYAVAQALGKGGVIFGLLDGKVSLSLQSHAK